MLERQLSDPAHDSRCDGLSKLSADELRSNKLLALDVGDIFGAGTATGSRMPFLATRADDLHIHARAMTSQFPVIFDRAKGEARSDLQGQIHHWRIVCMQPLPLEYHQLMLSLDRRMRLGSNGHTNPVDDGDKRALLYLDEHWARYPI